MKTNIIITIFLLFISMNIYAQDDKLYVYYYPNFEDVNATLGYVDSSGKVVIPAGKYPYIFTVEFDKIAFVLLKDRKGVYAIDRNEKILFQVCSYEIGPDIISNGLFRIIENGKIGFANMNGEIVIKPRFQFVYPFQENGFAIFCENGTWSMLDKYIPVIKGKWGVINRQGVVVIPATYDSGAEDYLIKDGKSYKLNKQGKLELK
ncbi:WG repeat-containing protein [Bacteroides ovatus]|uniref:WG repeat-containing protein n=1 Tax=Bacteroides ovatus TaxID=28116 RepID=A0A7J4Y1C7_BACOV|nr:WG repeat-containing protein [Bacteroides ovatus]KAA4640106.1 WG repeat-containing protein [Bacteroides ovatus]KAA4674343.1 WG repeat-containing protein [Bacteroides ovatus]KAA4683143.1 WG repeat-containing protein [Bacteroides ovatus]